MTPPPDGWQVEELDLPAYLGRIGVRARPPSRAALDELHEAHVRAFTFDNVDVLLDQHPGVSLAAVQEKFLGRGRGGYCFEHVTLFAAALERLGYQVERRLGRVGNQVTSARTHAVVEVTVDGKTLLADPGFTLSVLRPIPLRHKATDDHGGWAYKVRRSRPGNGWELHRRRGAAWELLHAHDALVVRPVDLIAGHHYTSTFPAIHFRTGLMLTRHGWGEHTTVTHEAVTVRRPGRPTERLAIGPHDVPGWLRRLGVALGADEEDRLVRRLLELRAALAG